MQLNVNMRIVYTFPFFCIKAKGENIEEFLTFWKKFIIYAFQYKTHKCARVRAHTHTHTHTHTHKAKGKKNPIKQSVGTEDVAHLCSIYLACMRP
jgi:hypothetical protein